MCRKECVFCDNRNEKELQLDPESPVLDGPWVCKDEQKCLRTQRSWDDERMEPLRVFACEICKKAIQAPDVCSDECMELLKAKLKLEAEIEGKRIEENNRLSIEAHDAAVPY